MHTVEQLEVRRLLASPDLDLAFGEGGVAEAAGVGIGARALVVREMAGGKYLAGGMGAGNREPVVARFNHDGTLDTSFDGDGVLDLPQKVYGQVTSAAFGADGKLVIVYNESLPSSLEVLRFNADGTVDPSFGTGGSVTIPVTSPSTFLNQKTAVQPDGKIVIGYIADAAYGNQKPYLMRLNADGSVDSGFGGGFANPASLPIVFQRIEGVATSPDGKVYLAGDSNAAAKILRFNSNGSIDTSFGGGDGIAEAPGQQPQFVFRHALSVTPDGRLVVFYRQTNDPREVMRLARLLSNGAIDPSFGGGDGVVELNVDPKSSNLVDAVVGSDGKITGVTYSSSAMELFRVRYSGKMDSSFGTSGRLTSENGLDPSMITLDSAGEILIAGQGGAAGTFFGEDFAIARLAENLPDVVMSASGQIVVRGSDDADEIAVDREGDQIVVNRNGTKTAFVAASVKRLTVYPSAGGDVITVTAGITCSLSGGSGNDTIAVGAGDVFVDAGTGNDRVTCGAGKHVIFLREGNDRATTGRGKDTIICGDGNDRVITGAKSDCVQGEAGDDSITCGSGWDSIYTGDGNDTVYGGVGNDKIQDKLDPPEDSEGDPPGLLTGHKHLFGGDGNDSITGSSEADTIFGNGGADTIQGMLGADSISGGGGNDEIWGNDPYDQYSNGSPDFSANTIHGGDGNDHVLGASGKDRLYGDGGNDRIYGWSGADQIVGGEGRDTVYSDKKDVLSGVEVRR
jgi:uncharacterized delta-60 repeat protein